MPRKGNIQNRQFWESAKLNNATFIQYYNRLTELAISMFEWKNLPDTVDPRYMELALFASGHALFFKDDRLEVPETDEKGYLCMRATLGGPYSAYDIPINRHAYSTSGYQHDCTDKDSVIIYNNQLRTGSMLDVEMFAQRLYLFDRVIDVNVKAQRTPVLIKSTEQQRLSLMNAYQKYDGDQPFIFSDSTFDPSSFGVLKTDAPYIADRIYELKTRYWNECLTYLGISNLTVQKKERLITDEAARSMGGTIASRYSRLIARQQAAEKINKMFGLNISVDFRDDLDLARPQTEGESPEDDEEVDPNE